MTQIKRRMLVVVLVVAVAAPGCSLFDEGLSSSCSTARQEFNDYLRLQGRANNAFTEADSHWTDLYNAAGELDENAIGLGVAALNTDLARATRRADGADAALTGFQQARRDCVVADLPEGCRAEFRQYQQIIDHNEQVLAAQGRLTAAVTAQRDATVVQNIDAANAATDQHNAAIDDIDALVDRYNSSVLPAYNRALDRCDEAT